MKIENIKTITLEDLKAYTHLTIYMDENIGILNGINPILQRHQNIAKLGCLLIAFCEEGEVLCNLTSRHDCTSKPLHDFTHHQSSSYWTKVSH